MTATEKMYNIILSPVVTEKAALSAEGNTVVFRVASDATKPAIKEAIESIYKVKVEKVNTLNQQGKVKVFRGFKGKRSDYKKAYVRLAEGQTIDFGTAV